MKLILEKSMAIKKRNKILEFLFKQRLTQKEKEIFFENFGLIISSDLDISSSLQVLKAESSSKSLQHTVESIEKDIKDGSSIWKSIERVNLLPSHLLSVIQIGERSGKLKENTLIVLSQMQKEREFKNKIRSASLYPVLVLILIFIVGFSMILFVLPRITSVYKGLNIELPGVTKALISLGDFLDAYGGIVIPLIFIVFGIIYFFLFIFKRSKHIGQEIMFRIPLLGRMLTEVEVARFGFLLGSLLQTGYPLLNAMDLLISSTVYKRYKVFYEFMKSQLEMGYTFSQIVDKYKYIGHVLPPYSRQLLISSEKSGSLSKSLSKIGEVYELKNENTLKNLSVLIEPILLIIVWLGVAFVALSIILPIYNLVGNINDAARGRTVQTN